MAYWIRAFRPRLARATVTASTSRLARRSFSIKPSLCSVARATTSSHFFDALTEFGVEACFVNLGSDHPSIIEAIARGVKEKKKFPKIYTCPNEMVALSIADGFARVTGRPQAVIVHVDVGTQALAYAMHNAHTGRCPVFIFAGLCPITEDGALRGSRTEYMHWTQDATDQKAIVSQYCRYTGELKTGRTVKQMVGRAMQFAMSDPKGPVYLCGSREVMEEEVDPNELEEGKWGPIGPAALPQDAVEIIAKELVRAQEPLVITGYSGRNKLCPPELVKLADMLPGLKVFDTGGSDVCFPFSHPAYVGMRYSVDDVTKEADVILVLDCDVPWIPSRNRPRRDARIYHVDVDPLNHTMPVSFFPANGRWRADSFTALSQLNTRIRNNGGLENRGTVKPFWTRKRLEREHQSKLESIAKLADVGESNTFNGSQLGAIVKQTMPPNTVFVVEAVTNAIHIADQIQPDKPGSWLNCGGTGIGWSGGAALGVKLGLQSDGQQNFVCQIVGDGTYLETIPSSVYWIASRYTIPTLTIVLNNKGWMAPRRSYELVHPQGEATTLTNEDIHLSFHPTPDYAGIAKAAAGRQFGSCSQGMYAATVSKADELARVLKEAVAVVQGGRGAIVEAILSD